MSGEPIVLPETACLALDGRGGARRVALAAALAADGGEYHWVHLQRDASGNGAWLSGQSGVDSLVAQALMAADTRPRCTPHGAGAIVILRGVNLNPGAEPEDMISVRLWLEERRVIGVWLRPLRAAAGLLEAAERGRAPVSPGDVVARLALRIVDGADPVVAELNELVDGLEDRIAEAPGEGRRRVGRAAGGERAAAFGSTRGALGDLRRRAIILRRYIAPQRDALTALAGEQTPALDPGARDRLLEAADRTTRLAEELEAVRDRVSALQDQLMDRRSEEMNRRMLLLAVVTAMFLPMGLVTGVLGINVGGMPGVDSPRAFWVVCALLLVLALALVLLFRRMRLL